MSIILSSPIILLLSAIAIICIVAARFVTNKYIGTGSSIVGFLLVLANITYALLLGADLTEILIYVLAFALIGSIHFLPAPPVGSVNEGKEKNHDGHEDGHSIQSDIDNEGSTDNSEEKK